MSIRHAALVSTPPIPTARTEKPWQKRLCWIVMRGKFMYEEDCLRRCWFLLVLIPYIEL